MKPTYQYDVARFDLTCTNPECPALEMTDDDLDDWLTQHGRMRFWIDTPADSYSGVYDVYSFIEHGTYEFYNMDKICCSLCGSGAAANQSGHITYTTQDADNPFFNAP